ncbi:hypothetical protein Rvan_3468 [Rhodomicrobium vannielii ATCC 17100]|jgi:hypothetical protein|uniref:Uncharacterized protein n=2 Tax=Rhodomicrobium TaxID=1068 RepID=E3I3Z9_RHOVT|nr:MULTISPECIES: hypothetical protein [Rhodomicrobium]ADP72648.1 hypothetical protein Rvan_3468 [Rhodomicrobium vannielii ATCC 17100]KAI94044.1 hypothetical protein T281_13200 [Rhodomicrobium udaipurense JA643]MBJ7534297.1 hypothetical protein [Rhodomicrobium vannielii ATCC 17100]MBJ7545057.1 hypothetical protein [Rhodomicrobium udaipurense]
MLSNTTEAADDGSAPEILIIKDIILRDLRRAHEARMAGIEERLSLFEEECRARFLSIEKRIDSLAAASEHSQKEALSDLSKAIGDIAGRLRLERGAAGDVG